MRISEGCGAECLLDFQVHLSTVVALYSIPANEAELHSPLKLNLVPTFPGELQKVCRTVLGSAPFAKGNRKDIHSNQVTSDILVSSL